MKRITQLNTVTDSAVVTWILNKSPSRLLIHVCNKQAYVQRRVVE